MIANCQALKNADEEIDFQTDFVTEIARLGFNIHIILAFNTLVLIDILQ